jgi:hypothetical protein
MAEINAIFVPNPKSAESALFSSVGDTGIRKYVKNPDTTLKI